MDTTEQDAIKPEEGDSSGNGSKGAVGATKDPRSFFADQLFSIAPACFLVIAVVWASYQWGYHTRGSDQLREAHVEMTMPGSFYGPLIGVIIVATVASFWAEMKKKLAGAFADESGKEQDRKEFKPLPDWLLQLLLYVLTGVVVFALVRLVALTGGFAASPFNELMTAPAVVGAFMAFSKRTPVQLMVIGIISVWLSLEMVDFSSPHVVDPALWADGTPKEQLHDPIPLVAYSWVFGLIATAMLVLAGGLSYYRHTRKPPQSPRHATLSDLAKRRLRRMLGDDG